MLTVTRDMMLPTAITGSYPRPLWFDMSLNGQSFKSALGRVAVPRTVPRCRRRDHQRAGGGRPRHRHRWRQPVRSRGRRQVVVLLSDRAPRRHSAAIATRRRAGWGGTDCGPGNILWEVQEAYQPGVVKEKLTRGPLEYTALWQVAQRLTDKPVKFGAICAPALASMLWNEYYPDDKQMVLDLCDIMNAEFREMAAAGCPLIQVEEPPHHGRSTRPDCTEADLEFLTEAFNRQLVGVNAEIWVHTCWGNPNQQRVYWEVPSYERAMPHLLQLECGCHHVRMRQQRRRGSASVRQVQDRQEDRHRRGQPLQHRG